MITTGKQKTAHQNTASGNHELNSKEQISQKEEQRFLVLCELPCTVFNYYLIMNINNVYNINIECKCIKKYHLKQYISK